MFRFTRFAFAALAVTLCSTAAHAEWEGKGELGLVIARGNTETETISAKADMVNESDPWKHLVGFSVLRSTSSNVTTADRYEVHGQSDYSLSARSYVLGALRYENDEFSPYTYQAVAALGYGYKFYDTEDTKLSVELGVGYRRTEDRLTGEKQGDAIARGGMNYENKLTDSTVVYDKLLVESGSDNTFIQNELGVKVAMNASLALSVAYLVRYNTDVDPPLEDMDELLTANLVFSF
jgi:putative salt-induced outer membrane protein